MIYSSVWWSTVSVLYTIRFRWSTLWFQWSTVRLQWSTVRFGDLQFRCSTQFGFGDLHFWVSMIYSSVWWSTVSVLTYTSVSVLYTILVTSSGLHLGFVALIATSHNSRSLAFGSPSQSQIFPVEMYIRLLDPHIPGTASSLIFQRHPDIQFHGFVLHRMAQVSILKCKWRLRARNSLYQLDFQEI